MSEELEKLEKQIEEKISNANNLEHLNSIKIEVFGKKGLITNHLKLLSGLSENERKIKGKVINDIKNKINQLLQEKNKTLNDNEISKKLEKEEIDITLSPRPFDEGKLNPITQTIAEVTTIFQKMGFETALGPDIEDDYHNFTALNIPPEHPARQLHDTFYLKNNSKLLRTHTSPVQIRTLEKIKPPQSTIPTPKYAALIVTNPNFSNMEKGNWKLEHGTWKFLQHAPSETGTCIYICSLYMCVYVLIKQLVYHYILNVHFIY